ncbi:MAG: hypothetical protein DMF93_03325 [Acidobacteria bacterium]|nr:MAG: hypothetical protein DMF93_03325 [Acidobacteriota bacterium]
MRWLPLVTLLLSISSAQTPRGVDVSALTIGSPVVVAELDLGKLKGALRRIAWSPDGGELYVQTAEGSAAAPKLRHYIVAAAAGAAVAPAGDAPEWAEAYWAFKSDRFAPGVESMMIDVDQKYETLKFGTGSAGAADRASDPAGAGNINVAANVEKASESQKVHVVRLTLAGETISEFVNEAAVPGLMFGWGPRSSPAWSTDGSRIAWAQKGRGKKWTLVVADVRSEP